MLQSQAAGAAVQCPSSSPIWSSLSQRLCPSTSSLVTGLELESPFRRFPCLGILPLFVCLSQGFLRRVLTVCFRLPLNSPCIPHWSHNMQGSPCLGLLSAGTTACMPHYVPVVSQRHLDGSWRSGFKDKAAFSAFDEKYPSSSPGGAISSQRDAEHRALR